MAQKVNPIAVRLNFNRFSDSSWFSDYYYSTLLYQDLNFRQYLSSIKQPNANKLGFRAAKCIIHHFPKRSLIHLFCLSDPRKKDPLSLPQEPLPSPLRALVTASPGEYNIGASLDRARELGLTYTAGVTIAPDGPQPLDQLTPYRRPKGPTKSAVLRSGMDQIRRHPNAPRLIEEEKPNVVESAGSDRRCVARPKDDSVMDTSENVLIRIGSEGSLAIGSPYWLKSSILQKKRALVNLHRGIAESLSQVCCAPLREQHLVAHSSPLSPRAEGHPFPESLWYRKAKGGSACDYLRVYLQANLGRGQAPIMQAVYPNGGGAHSLEPGRGMTAPLIADAILGTLSLAPRGQPKPHQALRSGVGWWSVLNRPWPLVPPGGREDPRSGLEGRQGRRSHPQLRHGALWAHYFNFYAMHYYFMHKMGDSLGRLPLRPFRAQAFGDDFGSYPQGALAGGGDIPFGDLGAKFREAAIIHKGSSFLSGGIQGSAGAQHKTPEGRFLQANPAAVYLLAQTVAARLNPKDRASDCLGSPLTRQAAYSSYRLQATSSPNGSHQRRPLGAQHNNGSFRLRPFVAPYSQRAVRSADGREGFFGSSSSNQITKSLDFYLSNVHSILSQNTNTFISLRPIKVHSVFQCASLVAQEVACKLEQKKSFRLICRLIFQQLAVCNYIKGIRITCSGRLNGAEIAKTECRKFGETSLHVFSDKIDYARTEASTPYGILGVKVWISYI